MPSEKPSWKLCVKHGACLTRCRGETTEELKLRRYRLSKACARAGKQLAATATATVALASAKAESRLEVRCSKCEHVYEAVAVRETVQQQKQRWERLGKACARKEKRAIDAATPAASAAIADADRSTKQALELLPLELVLLLVQVLVLILVLGLGLLLAVPTGRHWPGGGGGPA
jgi:hypothetical protein